MLSSSDQSASDHCEISQHIKSDSLQKQNVIEVVDLLSDDNIINPLSNFSIRDFVFNCRSKDIRNNWPFSKKSLQLCMKHEMKNVMPPFHALNSMKNSLMMASHGVENSNLKLSRTVSGKSAVDIENINSSESQRDKIKITSLPIQSQVKKGRLIVKLRNIPEQKSTKELPEPMASKVCPVCKLFTSSSNTTLNAHIDQCLSGEPMIEGSKSSKVIKHHGIKPRKIRLMADIYAAALECSLEDLDKRNGTNWASNSCTPAAEDQEICADDKKRTCSGNMEFNVDSDVYFDSKGRKLRILSKFSESTKDDCGSMNVVKEDAHNKINSSKKKKYLGHEHKLLNSPTEVINNAIQQDFTSHEGHKRKIQTQSLNRNDQINSNGLRMTKHLVTNLTGQQNKTLFEPEKHHHSKEITKKKGGAHLFSPVSSDANPPLQKRKENSSHNPNDTSRDHFGLRKRARFSSLKSKDVHGNKNHVLSNFNMKQLRNDGSVVRENSVHPPTGIENHVPRERKKLMPDINSPAKKFSGKRMSHHHSFSFGSREFKSAEKISLDHGISSRDDRLSSMKKQLSVRHSSPARSKRSLERRRLDFNESKLQIQPHVKDNLVELPGKNSTEKEKRQIVQSPSMDLNASDISPVNNNVLIKEVEVLDEMICELPSKIVNGEDFMAFGKSFSSGYEEQHADAAVEMGDGSEGKGNYFIDVDPIPIPGPPGSFLPSPGRMSSEEPLGNSSLTMQSLGNDHEMIFDMDSPNSPISNVSDSIAVRSDPTSFMNLPLSMESNRDTSHNQIGHAVENSTSLKLPVTTLELKIGELDHSSEGENLRIVPSGYQDSSLLRPCTMPSLALCIQENQIVNSFPACLNLELPSPTIRLMGKNLMLGNNDENLSPSSGINGVSTENLQKEPDSFHHISSQAPQVFEIMQNNMPIQHSGLAPSDILKMHPVGISASVPVGFGVNPFYSYPTRGYLPCGGYNMLHNVNIPVPHQHGVNVDWDRIREGSSRLMHSNTLTSSFLRPIGEARSRLNFPNGFM